MSDLDRICFRMWRGWYPDFLDMAFEINVVIAVPGSHMLLYHPVSYIAEAAV